MAHANGLCRSAFCEAELFYGSADNQRRRRALKQELEWRQARDLLLAETETAGEELLPLEEAAAMAVDGRLEDSKTVAAILRAYLRLKEG